VTLQHIGRSQRTAVELQSDRRTIIMTNMCAGLIRVILDNGRLRPTILWKGDDFHACPSGVKRIVLPRSWLWRTEGLKTTLFN
jgi:hypothetical protein